MKPYLKIFIVLFYLITVLLFIPGAPTSSAQQSRTELIEQALLHQLHPLIYSSLQDYYKETYPQFDSLSIVEIHTYITGNSPMDRTASASGGAMVFTITIKARAINHQEHVYISVNNEKEGSSYSVTRIETKNSR